ncbi:predicted protein [Sclerotinia sclerotiorum 1980 UF-70]|uniref:Uncharacterized protein n=1 Tax=Sclerotinia sclerotiorum (strain ATCC 18683 / 1980 / Ss-1) TaxID=665079 RepID=A7EN92_SCLS1|nr:predicted protein [Sclerotinia sclerotiorum 1980 UF-70]EDO04308.1 predicted protein [Sclerotinia sclerotiorum 1980 UF-70]
MVGWLGLGVGSDGENGYKEFGFLEVEVGRDERCKMKMGYTGTDTNGAFRLPVRGFGGRLVSRYSRFL